MKKTLIAALMALSTSTFAGTTDWGYQVIEAPVQREDGYGAIRVSPSFETSCSSTEVFLFPLWSEIGGFVRYTQHRQDFSTALSAFLLHVDGAPVEVKINFDDFECLENNYARLTKIKLRKTQP